MAAKRPPFVLYCLDTGTVLDGDAGCDARTWAITYRIGLRAVLDHTRRRRLRKPLEQWRVEHESEAGRIDVYVGRGTDPVLFPSWSEALQTGPPPLNRSDKWVTADHGSREQGLRFYRELHAHQLVTAAYESAKHDVDSLVTEAWARAKQMKPGRGAIPRKMDIQTAAIKTIEDGQAPR